MRISKKEPFSGKMERVRNLLKGNFWKIDLVRFHLTSVELDFLSNFYDVSFDEFIDDLTGEERAFIILQKKQKYINVN